MPTPRLPHKVLPVVHDVLAPDGSEIRVLLAGERGSFAHGTLAPGRVSLAVAHRTVEEIWYVTAGEADAWRQLGNEESVDRVGPGDTLVIPVGARFQFRTIGEVPFQFVMCTMPGWPGPDEAYPVPGKWEPTG